MHLPVYGCLLIDHVNSDLQSAQAFHSVLARWVGSFNARNAGGVIDLLVRAYGGWWLGEMISREREAAFVRYQEICPSLLSIGDVIARIRFEFADYLLVDERRQLKIDNTVGLRNRPERLRKKIGGEKCAAKDCGAGRLLSWMKTPRACYSVKCALEFEDVFERLEQKQVDVHLGVDALQLSIASDVHEIGILSSDLDLAPAALASQLVARNGKNLALIRNSRANRSMDASMLDAGVRLIDLG